MKRQTERHVGFSLAHRKTMAWLKPLADHGRRYV